MYAVVVDFTVKPDAMEAFLDAMQANAKASRETEPGCHRFDVCWNPGTASVHLYELYTDRAAFDAHMQTEHFDTVNAATDDLVLTKDVKTYEIVTP